MKIRRAEPGDVPGILAIEQSAAGAAHWSVEKYDGLFSNDGLRRGLVAEEEAGMLLKGFLVVRTVSDEWEIENIVVSEESRRHGYASQLLSDLLRQARSENAAKIWLEVRESNKPARRLYQRFLFQEQLIRANYYREPIESAIVYMLCL